MGKTNRSQMLSEKEIEDILYENYDVLIERKQFYRCIDKLMVAGYPIKKLRDQQQDITMMELCLEQRIPFIYHI